MHTPSGRPARQQTHSDEDSHDESADNTQKPPAKRGYTKMRRIAKMEDGKRLDVEVNGYNQFNCQDATTFANYLGTLVRNGAEVPLNFMNWRRVPDEKKDRLWDLVKLKWNVKEEHKNQVMKSFGKKLREFRHNLKKKHYDTHDNYDARIADRDERVLPDQWKFLISMWDSDKWQRVRIKRSPTRAEVYIITHCDKSGRPMNYETTEVMSKMDEVCKDQPELEYRDIKDGDLYGEIFGKDKHGRVRGLGLGPAPTDVWGDRAKSHRMVEEAREAQHKAEEAQRKMEEEREVERQELREFRAQMAEMKAQIAKLTNEKHDDAHQNNHPPVPVTDEGEDNYNQNNISVADDASSAASQQMPPDIDSIRIRRQKNALKGLNMAGKRERLVVKQAGKRERPVVKQVDRREKTVPEQDVTRYYLCSIARGRAVAEGYIISDKPDSVVGGHKLGPHYIEVFVDKVIVSDEPLIRPFGTYEVMKDADGKFIAWPKSLLKKM